MTWFRHTDEHGRRTLRLEDFIVSSTMSALNIPMLSVAVGGDALGVFFPLMLNTVLSQHEYPALEDADVNWIR